MCICVHECVRSSTCIRASAVLMYVHAGMHTCLIDSLHGSHVLTIKQTANVGYS